ncbi:MAG: D-glucuronyl C5-epimerase family protein [Calditrichaceae bacterium]
MNINKILFMIKKLKTDITNRDSFAISENLHSKELGEYYFIFDEDPARLNQLISTFDDNGIPLNSAYIDVDEPRLHYYPISIGQYGLAVFASFQKSGNIEKKDHFLRIADWFYDNRTDDPELGSYWLTDIPKPEYKIAMPWKSAFAQSRGLSILLRGWQITGRKEYFDVCKKALIPFTFDIRDGGVTANLSEGLPFYEEYVADGQTMVLDGHFFSLFGLYDFVRAVPESIDTEAHLLAKKLFDDGMMSLTHWLPEFDLKYWLRFNLCRMDHYPETDPCTIGYLRLINAQLKILSRISGNDFLSQFQLKIENYDHIYNIARMYPVKFNALKKLNRI